MTPHEAAALLHDELEAALADLAGPGARPRVQRLEPPPQLDAESRFRVWLEGGSAGSLEFELPATLAIGYLADEEAAVDEWRRWVAEVWQRLAQRLSPGARPRPA
jgi:hypothetical protein